MAGREWRPTLKVHQVRNEILAGAIPAGLQETACEKLILTTAQLGPMSEVTAGGLASSAALQGFCGDPQTYRNSSPHFILLYPAAFSSNGGKLIYLA